MRDGMSSLQDEYEVLQRDVMPIDVGSKRIDLASDEPKAAVQAPTRIFVLHHFEIDGSDVALTGPIERGGDQLATDSPSTLCRVEPDAPKCRAMTTALPEFAGDSRHANGPAFMKCEHDQGVAFAGTRRRTGIPDVR